VHITETKWRSIWVVSVSILSWVEKEIKPQEEHVSNGIAWWSVGKITQIRCMGDNRKGDRFDPS
jgi:hypothetical protein